MPLVLRELVLADIPAVIDITNDAFRDDPVTPALFPGGQTPEIRAFAIGQQTSRFGKNPNVYKLGVFDTDLPAASVESPRAEEPYTRGTMIATATWLLEDPTVPDDEASQHPPTDWPIGVNIAAHEVYFIDMPVRYKAVMGEKRCWRM
ncbi:hypothetical protein MMC11_000321 [Xylographa trunciseda]|nr:hypothetical protein [Xylographa trunciseda]